MAGLIEVHKTGSGGTMQPKELYIPENQWLLYMTTLLQLVSLSMLLGHQLALHHMLCLNFKKNLLHLFCDIVTMTNVKEKTLKTTNIK